MYFFFSEIAVEYTTLGKVRPTQLSTHTVNNKQISASVTGEAAQCLICRYYIRLDFQLTSFFLGGVFQSGSSV